MNDDNNLIQLRTKLLELQKSGAFEGDTFQAVQQVVLQIHGEAERRRSNYLQQAANLKMQAASMEAYATAYGTLGSVIAAILNGQIDIAQKRAAEEADRVAAENGTSPSVSASGEAYEPQPKKKKKD